MRLIDQQLIVVCCTTTDWGYCASADSKLPCLFDLQKQQEGSSESPLKRIDVTRSNSSCNRAQIVGPYSYHQEHMMLREIGWGGCQTNRHAPMKQQTPREVETACKGQQYN
jgi:hypothetical protein